MTEEHEARITGTFTGYSDAVISVGEGGSVTVKLTYDLDKLGAVTLPPAKAGHWQKALGIFRILWGDAS